MLRQRNEPHPGVGEPRDLGLGVIVAVVTDHDDLEVLVRLGEDRWDCAAEQHIAAVVGCDADGDERVALLEHSPVRWIFPGGEKQAIQFRNLVEFSRGDTVNLVQPRAHLPVLLA